MTFKFIQYNKKRTPYQGVLSLLSCGLFFGIFSMFCANEENIDKQCNRVHNYRKDKNVLEIARFMNDQVGNLVARQACNCPRRQSDTVQGRNIAHTVHVGKQSGEIAKSTAVTEVDEDK